MTSHFVNFHANLDLNPYTFEPTDW